MLYANQKTLDNCIYSCISDRAGRFYMPCPQTGEYKIQTIVDRKLLSVRPFRIFPRSHIIELRLIYSGASQPQEIKPIKQNKPIIKSTTKVPTKLVTNQPHQEAGYGSMTGQIFMNGKLIKNKVILKFEGQQTENHYHVQKKVVVKSGKFQLQNLFPGPYKFKVAISESQANSELEVFILDHQTSQVDIYFQGFRPQPTSKSGLDISITVIDASWNPQIGAKVSIFLLDGGYEKEKVTDENGEMVFHNIPAGEYRVRASFNGIKGRCELEEHLTAISGKFVSLVLRETE